MERRLLGKTKLDILRIGLGGIPIQNCNENDVKILIDFLLENNVNFIDTARGYTCSEKYIGQAIKGERSKFVLATKSMSRTYNDMKRDIAISLNNLGTDYIDLYQLHNLKSNDEFDIVMSEDGAYKALAEAKAEGKIKHIGITSHSYDFLNGIIDKGLFETIQFPYNIVESDAKDLFMKAHSMNIGTICMKPLAGGTIENGNLAIKYLLNDDNVDVVIPGMRSVEEAKNNLSAKKGPYTLSENNEINEYKAKLNNDFCRRCGYCAPCTKGIDITNCFVFHGYLKRYNLKEWAISRYDALSAHASDCIKCGLCVKRCPYNIDIPKKLEQVCLDFGK